MRLLSAKVRNYRVHGDPPLVQFDPARTLIGGPNECGKSTLVEAIHRALFLKATVTGEALESMRSTIFSGAPEVEVRFEARGAEYVLGKRFSGQSGTVRLTQVGGSTWQGEEAETQLSRLLDVKEVGGGRGILDRVKRQWAHLWVWQGESSEDLSEDVEAQQAGILRRLQEVGGAVARQSELDDRVASRFSQARADTYGKSGSATALKSSELGQAQAEVQLAQEVKDEAAATFDGLRHAMEAYEQAASDKERAESALAGITRQRKEVEQKLAEVERLRHAEENQQRDATEAAGSVAALEVVESNLAGLREQMDEARRAMEPLTEKQRQFESRLEEARYAVEATQKDYGTAAEKVHGAQLAHRFAEACVKRFGLQERIQKLSERLELVNNLETEREEIREQLDTLVAIDQSGLEELQALDSRLGQASAALKAMAAEVEVVATDLGVLVGGVSLAAGERQNVADTAEVTVGDSVRLRIHPGGGDALSRAREEMRTCERGLRDALDGHGLPDILEATRVVTRRADLQKKAEVKEGQLGQWDADDLAAQRKEAERELAATDADIGRRQQRKGLVKAPQTLKQAEAQLAGAEDGLRTAQAEEDSLRSTLEELRQQMVKREDERNLGREALEAERKRHTQVSAKVDVLVEEHGSDKARAQALERARARRTEVDADLVRTRQALESLQPESLERDRERLERAGKETDDQRQEAERALAVSHSTLRSDGAEDPKARLSQAEARLEAAEEHLAVVERKARAITVIDGLFQEEQRALADQFSKPLAEKIDAYLQSVFGSEARVAVSFEDNRFRGVQLARSAEAGATPFGKLSVGAREQVAAAVRLAIAELLATDHDGTLPIVFDDAFAYSDPERVNALQRMLDLGATHGLQVIVLTCNPSDYVGLGASVVSLGPGATE
jgi:DNA repair exonuclease SbcCD ATPase subunit